MYHETSHFKLQYPTITSEPHHEKTCFFFFAFLTRSDTNQPVQPQKIARLEIWDQETRDSTILVERSASVVLQSSDVCFCFSHTGMQKAGFAMAGLIPYVNNCI